MRTVDLKKGHLSRLTPLQAVSPATLAFFPLLLPQGLCTGWYHCLRWLTLHPLSHKTNSFFRFQFKSHFLSKAFPDTLDRVYFSVLYSLGDCLHSTCHSFYVCVFHNHMLEVGFVLVDWNVKDILERWAKEIEPQRWECPRCVSRTMKRVVESLVSERPTCREQCPRTPS